MKYGPNREIIVDAGTGGCCLSFTFESCFSLFYLDRLDRRLLLSSGARPMTADEVLAADWSARFSPAPPTAVQCPLEERVPRTRDTTQSFISGEDEKNLMEPSRH